MSIFSRICDLEKATAVAYLDTLSGEKYTRLSERVTTAEATGLHYRLVRVKDEKGFVSASIEIMTP